MAEAKFTTEQTNNFIYRTKMKRKTKEKPIRKTAKGEPIVNNSR